jgi:hypothetical protein
MSRYPVDPNIEIRDACCAGDAGLLNDIITKRTAKIYNCAFVTSCCDGHTHIVKEMIKKGATDFNKGLYNACESGHLEIAQLCIEHGATAFNWGLRYACMDGQLQLVQLMIEKGANRCSCGKSISDHLKSESFTQCAVPSLTV